MSGWWSDNPDERYWVEIRWAKGIGRELRCPQTDTAGLSNPWYDLLLETKVGDIVYHWNAHEHRFVGRSKVAGQVGIDSFGDRVVPLTGFQGIRYPVTLETLRALTSELVAVRDRLRTNYPGTTLYLPFQYRRDGIRMMSNYFAKFPAALVPMLFGASGTAQESLLPSDPVEGPVGDVDVGLSGGFLKPFTPKADSDYVTRIDGGPRKHGRKHETLVNSFARWLESRGLQPGMNAAIDLGLDQPPVVVEAKILGARPASAIRQAVGQLYEYRYFKVADPAARLVLLVDDPIPNDWVEYLEHDRGVGVVWPMGTTWNLSDLAQKSFE